MKERQHFIDWLKAAGIILVVFGHLRIPALLDKWIYSFHLPLFFIVSGTLGLQKVQSLSLNVFFSKRIIPLFKAYITYAILGLILFVPFLLFGSDSNGDLIQKIGGIAFGSGTIESSIQLFPKVLWYFPALITGYIISYFIFKLPNICIAPTLLASFLISLSLSGVALPWEIESGFCTAFYLGIGKQIFEFSRRLNKPVPLLLFSGTSLLFLGALLAYFNVRTDFRISSFGNPFLYNFSAFSSILGLSLVAKSLPPSQIVRDISDATIVIFPLHTILFLYSNPIAESIFGDQVLSSPTYIMFMGIFTVASLTALAPYVLDLLRLAPRRATQITVK